MWRSEKAGRATGRHALLSWGFPKCLFRSMTPAVNFPLFPWDEGVGRCGSWQGFDLSECEEPGGPTLEVFSQERAPAGALTTNNCTHKCGSPLGCVSDRGSPQTHPAPCCSLRHPGRSKEPGAETAPLAKMPEPQPPPQRPASLPRDGGPPPRSLIRNLPEPGREGGAGTETGWEQG